MADHIKAARDGLTKIRTEIAKKLMADGEQAKADFSRFEKSKATYEATSAELQAFDAEYPGLGPKKVAKKRQIKKVARRIASKKMPKKAAKAKPAKKAAKAKPAKAAKKSAKGNSAAAEGRRAVARGDRPTIREAVARVMGTKVMGSADIVAGLTKKGWLPGAKDPRTYCLYTLSDNKDVFERVERGRYKVRAGVVFENGKLKKAPKSPKAAAKPKNNKPATPKKSEAAVQAGLNDLGIGDDNVAANPFAS